MDLPRFYLVVLLQYLNSVLLALHLVDQFSVVVDEVVEQRREDDVVVGPRIAVAVNGEVEVYGDHRVVYNPAILMLELTRRT